MPDWVEQHIIKPLDGFRLVRADDETPLCELCAVRAGELVWDPGEVTRRLKPHKGCAGLTWTSIYTVAVNVKRQQGKTTGGVAYSLSELFLGRNSSILYMAASEKQSQRIFDRKFAEPIRRHPKLKKNARILGSEIKVTHRGNWFKFIPASAKSAPSGTFRLLIIDEARDVSVEAATALIPSVLGANGWECPRGHHTFAKDTEFTHCPTCGSKLSEWSGRVLVMSSSGRDEGWFYELIEQRLERPVPSAHVFSTKETLNVNYNQEAADALELIYGDLPSMGTLLRGELHNEFVRQGTEFLPQSAIKAVTNKRLTNVEGSEWNCVGFLDCSKTTDLTSLVICGDPGGQASKGLFGRLVVLRIDVFDPAAFPHRRVDYKRIRATLDVVIPRFPRLLELGIDVRQISDAQDLADWAKRQPWGRGVVREYQADALWNDHAWTSLERRVIAGPRFFQIPPLKRLYSELKSAAIHRTPEGIQKVVDSAKGNRRGRIHRDVAMSLAGCSFLADVHRVRYMGTRGASALDQIERSIRSAGMRTITGGVANQEF